MNLCTFVFFLCMASVSLGGHEASLSNEYVGSKTMETPKYLYKVLSVENWHATQNSSTVELAAEDEAFIHFSTEEQLPRILTKYWADIPQFMVLKIASNELHGELVYEKNPGGAAKYYHLYNGNIPLRSIVEAKLVSS